MSGYKISDEDIDGVVRYMKHFHPEHADYAYCKELIETFQSGVIVSLRKLALNNPDDLEEMYEQFEAYRKKQSS